MALTTTTTSSPRRFVRATWSATSRMRSGSATEVPPNFWTTSDTAVDATAGPRRPTNPLGVRPRAGADSEAAAGPTTVRRHAEREATAPGRGPADAPRGAATATQKVQRKRQARTLGLIIGAIVVVAGGIAIFSADDADDDDQHHRRERHHRHHRAERARPSCCPAPGASITGETPCPPADGSAERTTELRAGAADVHRPGQDLHRHPRDHRGRHRHRARRRRRARDRQQLRGPVPLPLLRRRALPPDRARLREPGRRPGRTRTRHRRAGLHDPRRAARRPGHRLRRRARSPWPTAVPRAAAASSSS